MSSAMASARRQPLARGVRNPRHPGKLAVVVHFDDDMFATLRTRALREGTSFGEQVRFMVQWGLEADDQEPS